MTRPPAVPTDERLRGAGATVPGWTLRAGVLVTGGLLVAVVLAGRSAGPVDALPALVLLGLAATLPGSPFPTLFLLVVGATQALAGGPEDLLVRLPPAAALVHAVHGLCALAAAVPPAARLERGALTGPARRWAEAQALCLPVLLGVWALSSGGAGPVAGSWPIGAAVLVAVVAAVPLLLLPNG